jgi:hypothetical protein
VLAQDSELPKTPVKTPDMILRQLKENPEMTLTEVASTIGKTTHQQLITNNCLLPQMQTFGKVIHSEIT